MRDDRFAYINIELFDYNELFQFGEWFGVVLDDELAYFLSS